MMKKIDEKNFVDLEAIKVYNEINGLRVIEELLLHKGEQFAGGNPDSTKGRYVSIKDLEYMALVLYRLRFNETNKLYVGLHLDRFYLRENLVASGSKGRILVPEHIYCRVKELNDKYRKP